LIGYIQSLILENKLLIRVRVWVIWCLTTLLTIFQLFYDEQFYWLRKLKIAIDLPQTLSQVIKREQVTFDKMIMMFTLSQNNILSWIFTGQTKGRNVTQLGHDFLILSQ
jgi:hypothetical protein